MKRSKCSHAVFVGDDVTDEDAFAEKGNILSIRIGKKQKSQASYFLNDHGDMVDLLTNILRRIE